jgi:hypothetical protein
MANAGEREMITDYPGAGGGELLENAFTGGSSLLGVAFNANRPVWVMKHNHIVMRKIDNVNELIATGLDVQDRMTGGMALGPVLWSTLLLVHFKPETC